VTLTGVSLVGGEINKKIRMQSGMAVVKNSGRARKLTEEIEIYVRYAVAEESYGEAMKVVARYNDDVPALLLLREFYRSLPEVREEPVEKMVEVASRQGVKLLAVITHGFEYLYAMDGDRVVYISENGPDLDEEYLVLFRLPGAGGFSQGLQFLERADGVQLGRTVGEGEMSDLFHPGRGVPPVRLSGGGLPLVYGAAQSLQLSF